MSPSQSATATPDGNNSPTPMAADQVPVHNPSAPSGNMDSTAPKPIPAVNGLQSQPMTATTSSASSPVSDAALQNNTTSSSTAAVPYGTRSRNRVGGARPNYAEDRDVDTEFELVTSSSRAGGSKRASSGLNYSSGSPSADNERVTVLNTRRRDTTNGSNAAPPTKEAIPGTSSFSANPNGNHSTTVSKKRKQPGSHQTTPASSTPSNSTFQSSKKFVVPANVPVDSQKSNTRNMMTFHNSRACLKQGKLKADDGTILSPNDHVYLVCEPPGEPYYLARIMEFLPSKDNPDGPIESVRVNWYYRPRDIHRKAADVRVVFASMHSDTCPLSSLRGKCQIKHQSEIENLDEYRKSRDCFWFEKMYDRYIQRYYEVIPTSKVINVPQHVKKVLDERWKYVLVEMGRRKDLTSAVKTCKRCSLYAANMDSVDCAVCHSTYHMYCVRPVLQKKPARGFAWACAACSRAQERKLEARNTPMIGEAQADTEAEVVEEEEEDPAAVAEATQRSTPALPDVVRPATSEQIAQAKLWPFRYLGIHCRVEDALDYDDRIYPRASSRLGPRHQANVIPWHGHPVQYVKARETKRKYLKSGNKKDVKLSKETVASMEAEKAERAKRPKWVMDEPVGYIPRGEDEPVTVGTKQFRTAELQFKMPDVSQLPSRGEDDAPSASLSESDREKFIDDYMVKAKEIAPLVKVEKYSTNFLDKALSLLYEEKFNVEAALTRLKQVNKYSDLKEPHLRPEEIKLFESGVAKYGSELRNVTKHVGTVPHRHIVRYYYMWKKTPKGRQIWGNFDGRRGRKAAKKADTSVKLVDDVADDHDDSAFDTDKAKDKKRGFTCKFCSTRSSRQWRRAPGIPPGTTVPADAKRDKGFQNLTVAICQRCAVLWRKYGIQWEDADEVVKKMGQGANKSWRRRLEEELLVQLLTASESDVKINSATASLATSLGISVSAEVTAPPPAEPAKKKLKQSDREGHATGSHTPVEPPPKKKVIEKPPEPAPIAPEPPRVRTLSCAICLKMDPMGDQHLSCRDCRLTVHRACYGVSPSRSSSKWFCDMCLNDRNPVISTSYECVLCPVTYTEHELMEPPKVSHKKKTDREREKERLEKEMVAEASKLYKIRQKEAGKPTGPREPLKRTAGNNWVHVACAVWMPEIKFGNAKELEPAEGLGLIPAERYQDTCKICKTRRGACVPCHHATCNARFHVGCAHQAGYVFGFDITPVKSTRRDAVNTIKLGDETGAATPAIWCPHHAISTVVHEMSEPSDVEGLNALQLYVQTSKQADLTLTGTVRKAAHVQQSVGASIQNGLAPSNRRVSLVNGTTAHQNGKENAIRGSAELSSPRLGNNHGILETPGHGHSGLDVCSNKRCMNCSSTFSPKWWPIEASREFPPRDARPLMNGVGPMETPGPSHPHGVSATPSPFQAPRSHSERMPSMSMINGDVPMPDVDRPIPSMHDVSRSRGVSRTMYECHKCHVKKQSASPVESEVRPSPYPAKRDPSLPAARPTEFPPHQYSPSPHAHPTPQPPNLHMPPIVPMHATHGAPEWRPEYESRPGDYPSSLMRNGIPSSGPPPNGLQPLGPRGFHSGPPPPPPHLNGYHASLAPHHQGPPPPHYGNGVPHQPPPPPHSYSTHQSPYGPAPLPPPGAHGPPPPPSRPYSTAGSPPAPHFSTPHTLGGLGQGPRMFSVERAIASPSASRRSLDPQRPATPAAGDETSLPPGAAPTRPSSSGRYHSSNGMGGSGASASPSLKNLLS